MDIKEASLANPTEYIFGIAQGVAGEGEIIESDHVFCAAVELSLVHGSPMITKHMRALSEAIHAAPVLDDRQRGGTMPTTPRVLKALRLASHCDHREAYFPRIALYLYDHPDARLRRIKRRVPDLLEY